MDWTVRKNLHLGLKYHGIPSDTELERALDSIGLAGKLPVRVSSLSGGEQQRVAILRAVLRQPEVILADEPTGNLDPCTADVVLAMLLEMWRSGKTLIMITHNEMLAEAFPRIIRLDRGRIVEDIRRAAP